jgi:hypothetical protein
MVANVVGLIAVALVSVVFIVVSRPGSSASMTIRTIAGTGVRAMSADGSNAGRAELVQSAATPFRPFRNRAFIVARTGSPWLLLR